MTILARPRAAGAAVMPDDDDLIAAVAPLRRQDPDLRAGREMPGSAMDVRAAAAMGGLVPDVRGDAEGRRTRLAVVHESIAGPAWLTWPNRGCFLACDDQPAGVAGACGLLVPGRPSGMSRWAGDGLPRAR
jgi:hypothetical protein